MRLLESDIWFNFASFALLLFELVFGLWIIHHVACNLIIVNSHTEYDWKSYMQFAEYYYNGERNFSVFIGGTGPLVYPAGHVYLFNWIYQITSNGTDIIRAQYIFHFIYIMVIISVFLIYKNSKLRDRMLMIGWMCLTSYRVHALFTLRLHNDCIATLLVYLSIYLMMKDRWTIGCAIFSLATSVKMNILLFAPGLLLLLRARFTLMGTLKRILLCALIQIGLAFEFLITYPIDYIKCAFELTRQFKYYSGISNRFMSPEVFSSRKLHVLLVTMQLTSLYLMYRKCIRYYSQIQVFRNKRGSNGLNIIDFYQKPSEPTDIITNDFIIYTMFLSNFIGITFSRSIHYNFYVWYYHTIPYLLWNTNIPYFMRFLLMLLVEYCYNVYPQNIHCSVILNLAHIVILVGVLRGDPFKSSDNTAKKIS